MKRLLLLAFALVAATVLYPTTGARADDWCWSDPTLVVNGKTVHIDTGGPIAKKTLMRSSTIVVTVPTNVDAQLTGAKTLNFPMNVSLVRAGVWSGTGAVPSSSGRSAAASGKRALEASQRVRRR